jgi:predicted DNA-binding transcriptional regulator AlpA
MTADTMGTATLPGERLLTRAMLRQLIPVSDMAIWRWLRKGTFPQPIRFNGRRYWRLTEITAWLESNAARSRPSTGTCVR